jgi:hypothetical protein
MLDKSQPHADTLSRVELDLLRGIEKGIVSQASLPIALEARLVYLHLIKEVPRGGFAITGLGRMRLAQGQR